MCSNEDKFDDRNEYRGIIYTARFGAFLGVPVKYRSAILKKSLHVHKFVEYYPTAVQASVGQESTIFPKKSRIHHKLQSPHGRHDASPISRTHKYHVPQHNILSPGLPDAWDLCTPAVGPHHLLCTGVKLGLSR